MATRTFFIRLDKIGDLVATLPVDQADFVKPEDPTWIVDSSVAFLPELAEPQRRFFKLDLRHSWQSYKQLKQLFIDEAPTKVVIFYAPWWVSFAAWMAKVPLRIGRKSQWHSFLFLNKALRQSRSQSEKHEADYNWELLHFAYSRPAPRISPPFLKLQAGLKRHLFDKYQLRSKSYVVVHPGMAGSALNWPQENYNALIERMTQQDMIVVITGTKADAPWLTTIAPRWKDHPRVRNLVGLLNIDDLVFILQSAKCVIAPSTGVLHLGAAAGTPVVGIYSPVKAHHPQRWGPRGLGAQTLLPKVECPATISCLKEKCKFHPCMTKITVDQVLEKVNL